MHRLILGQDKTTVNNSSGRSRNVWIPHFLDELSRGLNFPRSPLSLSTGAGAIWKLPLKVKHTASVQQTLHRWCLRASKCSVVYNLQSPVFPVMALPMALLQPCHRNQSNQLLQHQLPPLCHPCATNCHPFATPCHLATPSALALQPQTCFGEREL